PEGHHYRPGRAHAQRDRPPGPHGDRSPFGQPDQPAAVGQGEAGLAGPPRVASGTGVPLTLTGKPQGWSATSTTTSRRPSSPSSRWSPGTRRAYWWCTGTAGNWSTGCSGTCPRICGRATCWYSTTPGSCPRAFWAPRRPLEGG